MGDLAKATTTEPTGEPGRRAALLDEQWRIGPKMHGGYLLGVLAQAALDEVSAATGHDVPEAVTSTFLRAPDPGPAVVTVDVLRRGRGVTQVRVRLDQDDTPCVEAAVVLAADTGAARTGSSSGSTGSCATYSRTGPFFHVITPSSGTSVGSVPPLAPWTIIFNSVDLPAPFAPIMPIRSRS